MQEDLEKEDGDKHDQNVLHSCMKFSKDKL